MICRKCSTPVSVVLTEWWCSKCGRYLPAEEVRPERVIAWVAGFGKTMHTKVVDKEFALRMKLEILKV